ncbi:MAG: hypothetical protein Q3999_04140 [Buchananella hordeovulneris]|nr:hypothetical protein [Buchananella hordeovulneris]
MTWVRILLATGLGMFGAANVSAWLFLLSQPRGEAWWMLVVMAAVGTLALVGGIWAWSKDNFSLAASALLVAPFTAWNWAGIAIPAGIIGLVVIAWKPMGGTRKRSDYDELEGAEPPAAAEL